MEKITKKIVTKWDNLYKSVDYAFGTAPNEYFKTFFDKYNTNGSIILPGEGEGRNAVYAATLGLDVFAFDVSIEGKKKALQLAELNKVNIRYEVGDFLKMALSKNSFDVAALIYTHFHPKIRIIYHQKIADIIKTNGWLILEGFSINNSSMIKQNSETGFDTLNKFYSIDSVKNDFPNFKILELDEHKIELDEGVYHKGIASVIRFVGRKR